MNVFPARTVALLLACAAGLNGCARDSGPPSDPRDVIELRWVKAYPRESRSDVETGLLWGLSLLGAELPADARVIRWHDDQVTVDLARARVLDGTQPAWRSFIASLKASGEYRERGALDVGRFMTLALGSHYYELTGAVPGYAAARARYRFDERPAAIVHSAVALGSRRIDISEADRAEQVAFVGYEGHGSFADGSFAPHELELLDTMPNGQIRFALYDLDGHLKAAATPELTAAGRPAKCMWCHESHLQPTFVDYPPVSGFYGRAEFEAKVAQRQALLNAYRDGLKTQIRYRNLQDHTYAELLYLTFEEPSRERLALEWGVSVDRAAEILRGKPTHAQAEFHWLGSELYWREDVDGLAPYAVLAAPRDVRELPAQVPPPVDVAQAPQVSP